MTRVVNPISAVALAALLLLPPPAAGQVEGLPDTGPGDRELVDGIAAVVGDSIVLHSQISERIVQLEASGQTLPDDPEQLEELRRQTLQQFVDELLFVQDAEQDSLITVTDAQVDQSFDAMWDDLVTNLGGEANLRQALEQQGLDFDRYRAARRNEIRRNLLLQQYFGRRRERMATIPVAESEVREFFEEQREQLGQRPATLTWRQVFFQPEASPEAREAAVERAEEILDMLRDGEDFEDLARRFSDDTASAEQGGDLGWYRRGDELIQEFEDAAFQLREGQISGVVETDYGAHIIRIDRVRGPERRIRHILIRVEPSPEDLERLRTRMEEIADEVRSGVPLDEFADEGVEEIGQDSMTYPRDRIGELPIPDEYGEALASASEGEVIGPTEFPLQEGASVWVLAHVREVREAGEFTFEDVRDQIRTRLREEKLGERLLRDLRSRMYVDIRL